MNPASALEALLGTADILQVENQNYLLAPVSSALLEHLATVGSVDDDLEPDDWPEDNDPKEDDDPPEDGDPGEHSNRFGLQPSPDCLPPEPGPNGQWRYPTK